MGKTNAVIPAGQRVQVIRIPPEDLAPDEDSSLRIFFLGLQEEIIRFWQGNDLLWHGTGLVFFAHQQLVRPAELQQPGFQRLSDCLNLDNTPIRYLVRFRLQKAAEEFQRRLVLRFLMEC